MRTALYSKHLSLGAKMVPFAGWEMPVQYQGIIQEHHCVRQHAGIFDVSHMGRVNITGPDAEKLMDYLSTNRIDGKKDFSATYTVWCKDNGRSVDDLIVYKRNKENFFVIVNAGNREKDLEHLKAVAAAFNVRIEERYSDGILAVQGPRAKEIISRIFAEARELKPMHFAPADYQGEEVIVSGTGYTGAGGVELYGPVTAISELWDRCLRTGKDLNLQPVGLGARDTLRLEAGFALYGHELSEDIAPTESVSAWTVKWDKEDFLGKKALEELENNPRKRHQCGIVLTDKGIAREGYDVFSDGVPIGKVTSGTLSPTLNQAIAMIMVERKLVEGDNIQIQIRSHQCNGKVVKLPFYRGERP